VALRFVAIALLAIVANAIDSYAAVSQPVSGNCELDNDMQPILERQSITQD
jgi:hypothetical protein